MFKRDKVTEHSADLVFEIFTSDIREQGGYNGKINAMAQAISDAGLIVTGENTPKGAKMIITADGPEQCSELSQILNDFELNPDFIEFVMDNPLQHQGMDFEEATEEVMYESVKSPALRNKILQSLNESSADGCRFIVVLSDPDNEDSMTVKDAYQYAQSIDKDLKWFEDAEYSSQYRVYGVCSKSEAEVNSILSDTGLSMDSVLSIVEEADRGILNVSTQDGTIVVVKCGIVYRSMIGESVADKFNRVPLNEAFSKAQREKLAEDGLAMKDGSFPIRNKADLKKAIQSIGRAKDEAKAKRWIKKRAKELGCKDLIPEEWNQKSVNESANCNFFVILSDSENPNSLSIEDAQAFAQQHYLEFCSIEDAEYSSQHKVYGVCAYMRGQVAQILKDTKLSADDVLAVIEELSPNHLLVQNTDGDEFEVIIDSMMESEEVSESKKETSKVESPYGKVKVNGKRLCECGKGELRQFLREAKQDVAKFKKELKELGESASKRDKKRVEHKLEKAEKLVEVLEEEIKFNPNKGVVNESVFAEFSKWAKMYEAEEEALNSDEETEEPSEEKDADSEKKEDDKEEAELEAIVLTVKDTEKVKKNLIDAGIPEEHIEIIADKEDENSKEGKIRVDAEDAMTLKDYLGTLGIDLEEEIGAELVDPEEEETSAEDKDKEDKKDSGVDDSDVEISAEDIFGEE